ncbi:MAG: copper resistance protein CopC [Actinomycetota bacterium]|nr:copper resistance protein CopC [Actinomycetota bacterium]
MRRLLIVCAGACLALTWAAGATAQQTGPEPVSSKPEDGETVHRAPDRVEMTFSEPLDESSNITVYDECDRVVSADTDVSTNEMSAPLTLKPSGHYRVEWEATGLAGASGTNRGDFDFHAHLGDPCDPEDDNNDGHNHNGNGNKHQNHDGDHNGDGDHGTGHGDTGHGPSMHTTDHTDHLGTDHGEDHPSGDHEKGHMGGDHGGGKHRGGKHDGRHHGKGGPASPKGGADHPRLSSEGPSRGAENDALNLLLALALPALLGVGGGTFLRTRLT